MTIFCSILLSLGVIAQPIDLEEAMASFVIHPDFQIELVAEAENQVQGIPKILLCVKKLLFVPGT